MPHGNSPSLFPALQTGGQLGWSKIKIPLAVEISKSQTRIVLPLPRWGSSGQISPMEGAVGFEGGGLPDAAQKGYPPILPGSLGRSGHNRAAPCAPAGAGAFAAAVSRPQASRPKRVHPKLAFLTAGLLGPRLQGPEAGTRQGEKRRQPAKPSQDSSSCYSLTNMAAADAAAACPGRAPSRSGGSTSWPNRSHLSIFSSKQSLLQEGSRPRAPSRLPEGRRRPRCAREAGGARAARGGSSRRPGRLGLSPVGSDGGGGGLRLERRRPPTLRRARPSPAPLTSRPPPSSPPGRLLPPARACPPPTPAH